MTSTQYVGGVGSKAAKFMHTQNEIGRPFCEESCALEKDHHSLLENILPTKASWIVYSRRHLSHLMVTDNVHWVDADPGTGNRWVSWLSWLVQWYKGSELVEAL